MWGLCFIIFFLNLKETFRFFLVWIKLIQGSYILTGGLFYLLGDIFDKRVIYINRNANFFIEELLEFNATFLMLMCAIYSLSWAIRREALASQS